MVLHGWQLPLSLIFSRFVCGCSTYLCFFLFMGGRLSYCVGRRPSYCVATPHPTNPFIEWLTSGLLPSSGCDRKCCYKCPCGTCMCVSSGTHPGTELLRHMVARTSMLKEPPGQILSWPCHFVFLSGFGFFHILSSSCYLTFKSQVVIFNDHFPPLRKTDSIHSIFSILLSRIAKFHLVS